MIKLLPLWIFWIFAIMNYGIIIGKWGETEQKTYGGVTILASAISTALLVWLTLSVV